MLNVDRHCKACTDRQRGAALLILLTIIVLAASYSLLRQLNGEPLQILRAADDSRILGQAKAALLGYALSASQPVEQPGRLPCPDYGSDGNFDGLSDACDEQASYVTPGRLPWRELGLAELRDQSGELLWYAPALELDGGTGINSDTTTSLRLDGGAAQVAAVIIAPGAVLGNQTRPANLAAQDDPARYLEDANTVADVNFVSAPAVATVAFNDQLMVIQRDELLQAVERRVLGEIRRALDDYYALNGYYPYPAALNSSDCDSTLQQGQIPEPVQSGDCTTLAEWPTTLPGWFSGQGWNRLVWYAPAPACSHATPNCSGSGLLDVANTPAPTGNKQALLVAAGPALGSQARSPAGSSADLLDSTENRNGDAQFERLPLDVNSNDQILIVAP